MKKLLEGLREFVTTVYPSERELFQRLAGAQAPETLFVTCSDSRLSPTLLTGAKPGELFVLRNAGNIVPPGPCDGGEGASIEYAVEVLKIRDLIVCGHSDCGAVKALLDPKSVSELPAVASWLRHTDRVREILEETPELAGPERVVRAIELNVLTQLGHLQTHRSVVRAMKRGDLRLHGWVWDIGTGGVRAFDADVGTFVELVDREAAVAE